MTPDALLSDRSTYDHTVWRVVEAQHRSSTLRLTDSLDEQFRLEQLIESIKPALPPACHELHYLLASPFRYEPYDNSSRFRRMNQRDGAFYAAERVETAIAELAFYRLLFFKDSPGTKLPERALEHTAFSVLISTKHAIDLTAKPYRDDERLLHPTNYDFCHELADLARQAGIELFRYMSLRDPEHRANVAVFSPAAFASRLPEGNQTWRLFVRNNLVQAVREFPSDLRLEFKREDFSDPRL